jgi:hypothetical protein
MEDDDDDVWRWFGKAPMRVPAMGARKGIRSTREDPGPFLLCPPVCSSRLEVALVRDVARVRCSDDL